MAGSAKDVRDSTTWVAGEAGDAGVEVDENTSLYDEGHVPGAVKLHWQDDLQDPLER